MNEELVEKALQATDAQPQWTSGWTTLKPTLHLSYSACAGALKLAGRCLTSFDGKVQMTPVQASAL